MSNLRFPIGPFAPPATFTPDLRTRMVAEMAAAPAALRSAVETLNTEQLLTPYREGGWTVAQVVHHLADSHMNSYVRFRLALTESEPTIKPYSETSWAALPDASSPDIEPSLCLLESLHERFVVLLQHMTGPEWERGFIHPERGRVTLERNLALYAWHGRHHVAHITSLRARMRW